MSDLKINIVKQGEQHPDPIPDDMWEDFSLEKILVIERATVLDLQDGRYPQIQLVVKNPKSGKYIGIGTTMRLLNGVLSVAKGVAQRNGLHDF